MTSATTGDTPPFSIKHDLQCNMYRAEIDRLLQAGQTSAALKLIVRDASELHVTTRMTDLSTGSAASHGVYLRTHVDLLTGEIQNEIGQDVIASGYYVQLQQLHTDRIIASQQIVCGYLQQIQSILTALPPTSGDIPTELEQSSFEATTLNPHQPIPPDSIETVTEQLNSDILPTRLTQTFRSILNSNSDTPGETRPPGDSLASHEDLPSRRSGQSIAFTVVMDDGIDLAADTEGEVWEEWVEDEDFRPESTRLHPMPPAQEVTMPNWEEHWARQQLDPLPVKPTSRRAKPEEAEPSSHWDGFAPEHVGLDNDPQPSPNNIRDPHQMDRLLADLDKISQR